MMPRPPYTVSAADAADIIAADAMLTLADSNLRSALDAIRRLRRRGVPERVLAERLGVSTRSVRMDGTGRLESAAEHLTQSRRAGTERRPSRAEAEQLIGRRTDADAEWRIDQTEWQPPRG